MATKKTTTKKTTKASKVTAHQLHRPALIAGMVTIIIYLTQVIFMAVVSQAQGGVSYELGIVSSIWSMVALVSAGVWFGLVLYRFILSLKKN